MAPTRLNEFPSAPGQGRYDWNTLLDGSPWELEHLWVHPDWLRRGIGRALLARAMEAAAEKGEAALLIDADPHAEAFYLAAGAQRVGAVAAPIAGQPDRVLPRLLLAAGGAGA